MRNIEYLLNDNLLLLEVEEYGQEIVAQVLCSTPIYVQTQTVKNSKTSQEFTIIMPAEYLGKAQILIEDIHLDLCPTTLPKNLSKS